MIKSIKFRSFGMLAAVLFFSSFSACDEVKNRTPVTSKDKQIGDLIVKLVRNTHYNRLDINDDYSKKALGAVLKYSDPNKRFLLQKDVNLFKEHELKLDDYLLNGDLTFFEHYSLLLEKREVEVAEMVEHLLQKPIKVKEGETVIIERDSLAYCKSKKDRKDRWQKNLAFMVNEKLYQLEKREKEKGDSAEVVPFDSLEAKARSFVWKKHKAWFKRLSQMEKDDRLSNYYNALISVYCPHTTYYPPKDKEDFDIGFTGKLEGIGATLSVKDGYIKVEKIVAGSACWKQGELEAGDLILEVGQGDSTPVDLYDMRLDKAVRYIRGPKGTEVRLTVKKISGEQKVIPIIRDEVVIEETYAKSVVMNDKSGGKYGYIHLPSFYADFSKRNGRDCAGDVLKEIRALKKDLVKGIVLDLRNNGGGSLNDAIKMAGYFIKAGPIVQVDGVGEEPTTYSDVNPMQQFKGDLIVLVNEYSASASEIFAAAIQDYGRGLIVGTNTYGKGTVQRFYPLQSVADAYGINTGGKQLGEVKETIAKFFRINGGATQLKGVKPDVAIPDPYQFMDIGEKSYDFALPWKSIAPASYKPYQLKYSLDSVAQVAQKEVDGSIYFQNVLNKAKALKEGRDKYMYPIDYKEFKGYKKADQEILKAFKNDQFSSEDWSLELNSRDQQLSDKDTILQDRMDKFKTQLLKDRELFETLSIFKRMK